MFCSLVSDWISNSPSVQFLCRQFLKYSFFCWLIFSIHCLVLIELITNNNQVLMGEFFLMEKFFAEFTFVILALLFRVTIFLIYFWGMYFEHSQASKIFTKMFHSLEPSTISLEPCTIFPVQSSTLDVWLGSVLNVDPKAALSDMKILVIKSSVTVPLYRNLNLIFLVSTFKASGCI